MNITIEREPNCAARLRVEVPPEDVGGERRKILQEFRTHARIPGFRPGKTPLSVIEKRFADEITRELESRLVREAFREATERKELRILNASELDNPVHHSDGSLTFTAAVSLAPEFELPEFKGLRLKVPDIQISDDDIDRELEALRMRFAEFHEVPDRPLEMGHFAVLDYSARLDGQPLEEAVGQSVGYLGGGNDQWIEMKDDSLLPGFAAALEGARPGEERHPSLEVPQDFPVEELRGATLDFHVAVKDVKQRVLPEVSDELAAQILPGRSLPDLRNAIRENLDRQLQDHIREAKVNQLLAQLDQSVSFDLPEELVTAETQGQADELVERGLGSGLSPEQLEARQGEIFAAASHRARTTLRTDFLLQRIAEAENITVSDAELSQRVAAHARAAGRPVKTFARELRESGRLGGLRHSLLLTKTIDFLLEHATIELYQPSDDDDTSPPD